MGEVVPELYHSQGIALLFAQQGANVTIHGLDMEEVQETYDPKIGAIESPSQTYCHYASQRLCEKHVKNGKFPGMSPQSQKFANKVVIVTGSSSGIGQGIALLFAQQGANVTIHGLDLEEVQETYNLLIKSGISKDRILKVAGNLVDPQTAENLINDTVTKWGKLDVLVNNAGVGVKGGIPADSEENYEFIFGINFKSVVRLNKLAIPHLDKSKGNIVNTCSVSALRRFPQVSTFYATSKAALDHYVKYESAKLGRTGIRINNIAPGTVPTNIIVRLGVSKEQFAENAAVQNIPLGRLGTPRDMANAVSFLASDEAAYITGVTLPVDGGLMHGEIL